MFNYFIITLCSICIQRIGLKDSYIYNSPIGFLELVIEKESLVNISFIDSANISTKHVKTSYFMRYCIDEFNAYFEKKIKTFSIPYNIVYGTDFQKHVWNTLREIPYGTTLTYKELAALVKRPNAYRAVGGANNKNPLPIILPCHRVIGSNKKLVGYAGGIWKKKFLLQLENNSNKTR